MQDDFPVIIPPPGNESAELILIRSDRNRAGYFQRKVVANVVAKLSDRLQDAAVRIGNAPALYDARAKWRMMSYGQVFGAAAAGDPEADLRRTIDLIRLYESWRGRMFKSGPMAMSICEHVCQQEESVYAVARRERMDSDTVIRFLQFGLNEYSILAGWGDQIAPR